MKCRHCGHPLTQPFLDLGSAPPSNAYLSADALQGPETWYPLRLLVCDHCWLVQTEDHAGRESLFTGDYAYFSSVSRSWLAHAQAYVAEMADRFALGADSHVVEVAANDGYLLQYVAQRGIPCTGIEPTASTARAARAKGLTVREAFFGVALARQMVGEGLQADLMTANNVLAHVPDINDFVAGFSVLLKPQGVVTFEFPHLLRMVEEGQFDTAYHEHYSYLSLTAVHRVLAANGLAVFDVAHLPTHGGSLRVLAQRAETGHWAVAPAVAATLAQEQAAGLLTPGYYQGFQARAERIKHDVLAHLLHLKRAGKRVMGYGAAAKGNTLINFAGIRPDLLPCVVDLNPAKQGQFLPGSRIPVVHEDVLRAQKPDAIWVLPWNLRTELQAQLAYVRDWGGELFTAVPRLETWT
jgi:2-polyprenyl-3-methyl-5-hydroxy-6-metoxy-1,4-benzoquinol methylase